MGHKESSRILVTGWTKGETFLFYLFTKTCRWVTGLRHNLKKSTKFLHILYRGRKFLEFYETSLDLFVLRFICFDPNLGWRR